MKIRKLGHCCLVIEMRGVRFLTDPGSYFTSQDAEKDIDCVVITHEHADHFHLDSLKKILANNPNAVVVTNGAVGKILKEESIPFTKVADGERIGVGGVPVTGHGTKHAIVYRDYGQVENTGYLFDGRLYHPGDAFHNPGVPVEVLALPVAGPWCKISEALDYTMELKPKVAFPVHDGMLSSPGLTNRLAETFLPQAGIQFVAAEIDKEFEIV
jgi:L-ascorbate metabolism protein UlaG (beta-lactamase superfamily)